jgi:hypothetical protein
VSAAWILQFNGTSLGREGYRPRRASGSPRSSRSRVSKIGNRPPNPGRSRGPSKESSSGGCPCRGLVPISEIRDEIHDSDLSRVGGRATRKLGLF